MSDAGTLDEVVLANSYLWPICLTLIPAALAFAWATRQRRRALGQLGNRVLVAKLVQSVNHGNRLLGAIAVTAALACIVVALMRPQYGGSAKVVEASGLDVVLVVDYSKSMLAQDVYPSRSRRLEVELSRFIEEADRRGDRVGVVVFAGHPRGFPVTRDTRMLKLYLDRADPRTENPGGTAIGKALGLALQFLVDARALPDDAQTDPDLGEVPPAESDQAIILLTDGEDTASRPLQVAQKAVELGVKIYTVGIGSKSGEPIQKFDEQGEPDGFVTDEAGNYVFTRLDEGTLQEIAKVTDGRYLAVDPKAFSLDEVRAMLEDLSRTQRDDTIEIHREEGFMFLLFPALALLSVGLGLPERRRSS